MTKPVWSHVLALTLKKAHSVRLQISACKANSSHTELLLQKTIPDCIRYIIGVFFYNFKSQMNILASY